MILLRTRPHTIKPERLKWMTNQTCSIVEPRRICVIELAKPLQVPT